MMYIHDNWKLGYLLCIRVVVWFLVLILQQKANLSTTTPSTYFFFVYVACCLYYYKSLDQKYTCLQFSSDSHCRHLFTTLLNKIWHLLFIKTVTIDAIKSVALYSFYSLVTIGYHSSLFKSVLGRNVFAACHSLQVSIEGTWILVFYNIWKYWLVNS